MGHEQYGGITAATAAAVALYGVRSYSVSERINALAEPADNDLWPQGALTGGGNCSWNASCDRPHHALNAGDTGAGGFTEHQGATSKALTIANQVITEVTRAAVGRGGRGVTTVSGIAYSSDGSTTPVTFAAA